MIGVIANTITVLIGSLCGLLLSRGIPEKVSDTVKRAIGLCTLYIGISGALEGENTLVLILSMAIGTMLGAWLDIDKHFTQAVEKIESKFRRGDGKVSLAEGFISASLLFCVGAMAVTGSLDSGLSCNHDTLYAKSMMDFVASIVFASTMGFGVMFSAASILVYQGSITLLATLAQPYLSDVVINEMSAVGSLLIVGIALNIMGITKIKLMNYVPAIFHPILLCLFM